MLAIYNDFGRGCWKIFKVMTEKTCNTCKWCGWNNPELKKTEGFHTRAIVPCTRIPAIENVDLVTGEIYRNFQLLCSVEREGRNIPHICGVEGRFWVKFEKSGD